MKRSIVKKAFALILTAVMVVGMMSGCSNSKKKTGDDTQASGVAAVPTEGEESSTTDYSEHMEISMAFWAVESALANGDDVLKSIEDKFNVKLIPQNVTWDDYGQKIQLWAASGSLPDMFIGDFRTGSSFYTWATEGLLKEIPSDLSAFPNLEAYMDSTELPSCQVNGKTYCIFRQSYSEQAETVNDRLVAYRWDLAQKAGVTKEPENWDEFDSMIQKIIKADPDNTNIQGLTSIKGLLPGIFFPYSMPLASTGGTTFKWVDKGDGTYIPSYFAGDTLGGDALATFKLARKMYENGTIEKEVSITTDPQTVEKFLQGQSAAITIAGGAGGSAWNDIYQYWPDIHGEDAIDAVKYLNLMPDVNGNKSYCIWDYAWSETYISSAVDDAKLNRILAIYNYLLSDEGLMLSKYGVEGKSYEVDESGKISYMGDKYPSDFYPSIDVFKSLVCWNEFTLDKEKIPFTYPQVYADIDKARIEEARKVTIPEFNYDCTSAFVGMGKDFSLTLEDDLINIMTGTDSVENLWQDTIDYYKSQGLDEIIAEVNEAVK